MKKGILAAVGTYLLWGLSPLYFKTLQQIPAGEIALHRVVWSFLFMILLLLVRGDLKKLTACIPGLRVLAFYALTALLMASNWLLYVWGVNSGHVVETSLGYFITPLTSVSLGVLLLREKMRHWQWVSVGLAFAGVFYLTIQIGKLPWIALVLGITFSLYGLLKKVAPLNSVHGMTVETAVLFLPALIVIFFLESRGTGSLRVVSPTVTGVLLLSGAATCIPLLLYSAAARTIPLSLLGILQYLEPTVQLLLGLLLYNEPFSPIQLTGYSIIWLALIIFTLDGWANRKRKDTLFENPSAKAGIEA